MNALDHLAPVWVCSDCYFAYHYGVTQIDREATADEDHAWHGGYLRGHPLPNLVETDEGLMVREWFAGDSDIPADREPLNRLADIDQSRLSDWTYDPDDPDRQDTIDEYGDGHIDFTWSSCSGCGSHLSGSRDRLAVHPE